MTYEEAAYLHAFFLQMHADAIEDYLESDSKVRKEIVCDRLSRAQSVVPQSMRVKGLEVIGRILHAYEATMSRHHFVADDGLPSMDELLAPSETKTEPPKTEGKNGKRIEATGKRRGRQPSAPPKKRSAT
jgi:hypothetical protein